MRRNCVITGGSGFIGRHLCRELVSAGYEIRVIDRLDPQVHSDSAGGAPSVDADECRHVRVIRADARRVVREGRGSGEASQHLAPRCAPPEWPCWAVAVLRVKLAGGPKQCNCRPFGLVEQSRRGDSNPGPHHYE